VARETELASLRRPLAFAWVHGGGAAGLDRGMQRELEDFGSRVTSGKPARRVVNTPREEPQ